MKVLPSLKTFSYKLMLMAGLLYGSLNCADLKKQWQEFLIAAQANGQDVDSSYANDAVLFQLMLSDLNALQALPLWRATAFYQDMRFQPIESMYAQNKKSYARSLVQKYADEYTSDARRFMQDLITYKNSIAKINTQCSNGFMQISSVQQLWQRVQNELIKPLTSQRFIQSFKAAPLIVKLVACEVMHDCVDTLDTTIKTMKSSNALSWNDRISQFKIMLMDFKAVCITWLQDIMPEHAIKYAWRWQRSVYLNEMNFLFQNIMQNSYDTSMFQRSSRFSVNAAMLGSCTAFERHYPQTAEDMFMLIHQNSLVAIAGINASLFEQKRLEDSIDLPSIMVKAAQYFETGDGAQTVMNHKAGNPQRIGIHYTPDTIELFYNMSLNNHSSTFQIIYDQRSQQCSLAVQFLGEARRRWSQVAFVAAISHDLSGLDLIGDVTLDMNAGITSARWVINNEDTLPIIAEYLGEMAEISFRQSSSVQASMLQKLYRGNGSFEDVLERAMNNYEKRYGVRAPHIFRW